MIGSDAVFTAAALATFKGMYNANFIFIINTHFTHLCKLISLFSGWDKAKLRSLENTFQIMK